MAPPSGMAAYKKKDGTLTVSPDSQSVSWIPAAGGAPGALNISVANVTNLQQTPASSPKVMLKIFVQSPNNPSAAPEQYIFSFTAGATARAEADAIKDALSAAIQAAKSAQATPVSAAIGEGTPGAGGGADGMSAAMAMASAVSSAGSGKHWWDDDKRLKTDVELQQSLLKADAGLQRMFMESLHTKPETLSASQFMSQFWSTRLHLLRAHAIERSQTRGSYNVLSTLKPRTEDNVTKLNISKEQIQLIFGQHPLVKRVYDENVPKLSESQFWSRFFQSRLFKKLRGERITDADATDAVLDKYLKADESGKLPREAHVPHFLDLEGNEDNNSQRRGNRPDLDMRPSAVEKVPIIRTLNSLSEKIMANVAPADRVPSAPVGAIDDGTYDELQLRDLRGDEEQARVKLNIRNQNRFFSAAKTAEDERNRLFEQQDPEQILQNLRSAIERDFKDEGSAPLGKLVDPEEDDDEDEDSKTSSRFNRHLASTQILDVIKERRAQAQTSSTSDTYGLSQSLYDRLTLTHATTTEFLHQFWQAFLSGNPDRAAEVSSLVESLNRAMERINAVAKDAEAERQVEVEKVKRHAREVLQATGKKLRINLDSIQGGEASVNRLLGPTIRALDTALNKYKEAYAEEMKSLEAGKL
ncbi:hypothetical protein BDW69DRAFT_153993, partial [Aspergillus filifer]